MTLALPVLWLWMRVQTRIATAQARAARAGASAADRCGLAGAGVLFAGNLCAWHWSITLTSVANATVLANVAPIFVGLTSWFVLGERYTRRLVVGLVVAMCGVFVLVGESFRLGPDHVLGDGLGAVTAAYYGGYIVVVRRLRARFSVATIMTWTAATASAALFVATLAAGEPLLPRSTAGWGILGCLALFSHAGGQSLIAYALAHLSAAFSSVGLLVQPIAAALLGWLLLAEPLGRWQVLGASVVLAGIYLAHSGSQPSGGDRGG
jgi:drug/metabolite transporter (DMT)-like permease